MNNSYAVFVEHTVFCIQKAVSGSKKVLFSLCEGGNIHGGGCSEYSCLCDEQAELFVWLLRNRADQIGLHQEFFQLKRSQIPLRNNLLSVRYTHSCYPKNIKRWMNGTVSRKKRCRAEFAALAACWAAGWSKELNQTPVYCAIRTELMECFFVDETEPIQNICTLFDYLWQASEQAYWNSLHQNRQDSSVPEK